jgi:hypothetical protein
MLASWSLRFRPVVLLPKRFSSSSEVYNVDGKSLGDRMKQYERASEGLAVVPLHSAYIIRVDGHRFSTFIRRNPSFTIPWDARSKGTNPWINCKFDFRH